MPSNYAGRNESPVMQTPIARGLASLADGAPSVVRNAGQFAFGIIKAASVVAVGEARGHGVFIDREFIRQVAAELDARGGVKVRFAHPKNSAGFGMLVGKALAPTFDSGGDRCLADVHVSEIGNKSPHGELSTYCLDAAEQFPADFGLSVAFEYDFDAIEAFAAANTVGGHFVSPDRRNQNNLPHARLKRLIAVDFADDPAANPGGLFEMPSIEFAAGESLPTTDEEKKKADAEASAKTEPTPATSGATAGQTDEPPASPVAPAPSTPTAQAAPATEATPAASDPAAVAPPSPPPEHAAKIADLQRQIDELMTAASGAGQAMALAAAGVGNFSAAVDTAKRYATAFGAEAGFRYLSEGLTFDAAQAKAIEDLRSENAKLRESAPGGKAKSRGEATPVSFSAAESKPTKRNKNAPRPVGANLPDNLKPLARHIAGCDEEN